MKVTFMGLEESVMIGSHDFLIHSESDLFHIVTDPSNKQIELDPKFASPLAFTFLWDYLEGMHSSIKVDFYALPNEETKDISAWWAELYNIAEYLNFDPNFIKSIRDTVKNGVSKQALFNFV
jgi:hypothetical protein